VIFRRAASFALVLPHLALAETTPPPAPPPPQIVATAAGEARLRPDRANILLGVTADGWFRQLERDRLVTTT
jgi:hypothetical protein